MPSYCGWAIQEHKTRLAKVVTSLRIKNLHNASSTSMDTILGHSLYDLGQGTRNKVIYTLVCSYSYLECFTVILCNKQM